MPHLREHGIHHFCVSKECLCRNSAKRTDDAKIVHSILVESQCRLVSRLSDPCGNTPSQYCISGICISTPRYTVAELCGILTRLPCHLLRTILSVIYRAPLKPMTFAKMPNEHRRFFRDGFSFYFYYTIRSIFLQVTIL